MQPRCIIIAGPNGAGKTTFAREYFPHEGGVGHFLNADLLAAGLSPLKPESAAVAAGRLLLKEMERLADAHLDFAFETTLSGVSLVRRVRKLKREGYRIELFYLRLNSPELAVRRIAARVKQGGHSIPEADVRRRFARSWENFKSH